MMRIVFEEPVVVWLVRGRHDLGVRRIWDVQEGLAALHRYGLETLRGEGYACREWRYAAAALMRARREPSPEAVARARDALVRAATKVGALVAPDPLAILATRGLAFAP